MHGTGRVPAMSHRESGSVQNLDELRELRVMLPAEVYRQLFSLKILRNVTIAETVTKALSQYFEKHPEAGAVMLPERKPQPPQE